MPTTTRSAPAAGLAPLLVASGLAALLAVTLAALAGPAVHATPQEPPPAPVADDVAVEVPVADDAGLYGFEWKWREGEVLRYRVSNDIDMTIAMSMLPEPMATTMQQVMHIRQEVLEVDAEGAARVRTTYESMSLDAEVPGQGTVSWSSEDPEVDPDSPLASMTGPWAMLVDESLTMRVDRRGELTEIEGLDDMVERLLDDLGEDPEQAEAAAAMRPMLEEFLSEENMGKLTQQGLLSFPAEPLTVGDAWTEELSMEVPVLGEVAQSQTYTLERFEGDVAVFHISGTLSMGTGVPVPGLPPELAEMMDIAVETDRGDVEGTIRFDRDRGLVVRQDLTMELDLEMTMTPKGEMAETIDEPMVVAIESSTSTVYELLGE